MNENNSTWGHSMVIGNLNKSKETTQTALKVAPKRTIIQKN